MYHYNIMVSTYYDVTMVTCLHYHIQCTMAFIFRENMNTKHSKVLLLYATVQKLKINE